MATYAPLTESDFSLAHPGSQKVYVDGPQGVRVPMREIALTNGESLRVYDTSGPQGFDVHVGLPELRRDWILSRGDVTEERRQGKRSVLRAASGRRPTLLH